MYTIVRDVLAVSTARGGRSLVQETIFHFISSYGYIGLFGSLILGIVGVPIPDEVLMTFVGYLVSEGRLHYIPSVIFAFAGSIVGMSVSFFVGHRYGLPLIEKYGRKIHLPPERLDKVERWFNRFGKFTVTIGYFIPGVRHVTAYSAGISKWSFRTFALYAVPGGLVWVLTFITLGYFLKENWEMFILTLDHYMRVSIILLIVLIMVVWVTVQWVRSQRVKE
jgi:membrane protein DedA with SNARE-associated domain